MKLWRNLYARTEEDLAKVDCPLPPEDASLWDAASDEALAKVEYEADNRPHLPSGEVTK